MDKIELVYVKCLEEYLLLNEFYTNVGGNRGRPHNWQWPWELELMCLPLLSFFSYMQKYAVLFTV